MRDVVSALQRGEMVRRIGDEIETMIIELGIDARLLRLQIDEIYNEIDDQLDLVVADYLPPHRNVEDTLAEMERLSDDDVLSAKIALKSLHLGDLSLKDEIAPRGIRLLRRVDSLSPDLAVKIANNFDGLSRLQRVSVDDLVAIDGVDPDTAKNIKATIDRITENTILDQYH